jgi:hypothetical protein
MADTDDDPQMIALEPTQHLLGEDDTEAARERTATGARGRNDERLAADVAAREDDAADHDDEVEQQVRDRDDIALTRADERELAEIRDRDTLDATAQTTEAIRLAEIDAAAARRYRSDADAERGQAVDDGALGNELLDQAAAGRDEPGPETAAAAADGRRHRSLALGEDRAADRDYDTAARFDDNSAARYDDAAEERHSEPQPPASEAARPPATPPRARKFLRSRKARQKPRQRSTESELGL